MVQDCDYVFGSSTKFQRRMNGLVKADICRQVSVCSHVFCGILFALKPFCDYSLCLVCILPQPAFYSQSVVYILHSVCILPLVRSLQSAVCVLHWPIVYLKEKQSICCKSSQVILIHWKWVLRKSRMKARMAFNSIKYMIDVFDRVRAWSICVVAFDSRTGDVIVYSATW